MTLNKNELEDILKTLPIGYYIGRKVEVSLDETSECSFYNPMEDRICISKSQLDNAMNELDESANAEDDVRTMLYHEVSHAFLTPKNMKVNYQRNVFEDERIETLLSKYYKRVNFKSFVKRINHFHGEAPKTADSAFYQLVRYRIGETEWLERVKELISKYSTLNREGDWYYYKLDIDNLYEEFTEWWNEHPEEFKKFSDSSNESDDDEPNNTNKPTKETNPDNSDESENTEDEATEMTSGESEEDGEYTADTAKELMEQASKGYNDVDLKSKIDAILSGIASTKKNNGSAINAYSGKFDPRAVIRDDYKYFVQQNRLGHIKAYSKVHLNLFIDTSGSFHRSQNEANKLLFALTLFEKQNPDFSFDVVSCSRGEKLLKKNEREIDAWGGNYLDENAKTLFRTLQLPATLNFNIVMFDGDAFTYCPSGISTARAAKNFSAFNTANTVIISDSSNMDYINKHCKLAKRIFTNQYVEELIDHTLKALKMLSR